MCYNKGCVSLMVSQRQSSPVSCVYECKWKMMPFAWFVKCICHSVLFIQPKHICYPGNQNGSKEALEGSLPLCIRSILLTGFARVCFLGKDGAVLCNTYAWMLHAISDLRITYLYGMFLIERQRFFAWKFDAKIIRMQKINHAIWAFICC